MPYGPRRPAILNCYIEFPLLNDRHTIPRAGLDPLPAKYNNLLNEKVDAFTDQATMAGLCRILFRFQKMSAWRASQLHYYYPVTHALNMFMLTRNR